MKKLQIFRKGWVIFASLLLLSLPAVAFAQVDGAISGQPPIAQQLVREGNLAIQLTAALGLGTHDNEAEAESILGNAGILPRNGWVADYPVTPDIIGELEKSIGDAANAGKIAMSKDEALNKLREIIAGMKLGVSPYDVDQSAGAPSAAVYPDQQALNGYYAAEGPPVVTYYAPPPYYGYLYSWVPYPFWYAGFGFGGFFVLNDFYRPCFFGNNAFFVSNHFRDFRSHRMSRINAAGRFHGRSFAGMGNNNRHGMNSTGTSRGGRHDMNVSRTHSSQAFNRGGPAGRTGNPAFRPGSGNRAFNGGSRLASMQSSGTRMNASFAHSSMRSTGSPSFGGGRMAGSAFSGGFSGGGSASHGGFGGSSGRGGGGGGRR